MAFGSSKYRQLQNFLQAGNQLYPLAVPGAKTFFVAPSTYTAVDGMTPLDTNDGETPQAPLAHISAAITKAVSGRGDTIVLMPGTHTITSAYTCRVTSKVGLRIVSLRPYAATITGDAVETVLIKVDSDDVELAGLRILGDATAAVTLVHLADTSAIKNCWIHHCKVIGTETLAGVTGIINGELGAGNNAAHTMIHDCEFEGLSVGAITTFGGGAKIYDNVFNIDDTAAATAISIGDMGAAFGTRKMASIYSNIFGGQTDAATLLAITWLGTEANSQMVNVYDNHFGSCGSGAVPFTQDRHNESIGWNFIGGDGAPVLIDPKA